MKNINVCWVISTVCGDMFKVMAPDRERAELLAESKINELYSSDFNDYSVVALSEINGLPIESRWEEPKSTDVEDEVTIEHIAVLGYN